MSALADRLRTLRTQAGAAALRPAAAAEPPARRPLAALDDLRRLLGVRSRAAGAPASIPRSIDREVHGEEIAPGLRYTESHTAWPPAPERIDAGFARLARYERHRLLCFDTETTGLAGGTGTRAFMIGAADWHPGGLRVRQLTLTTLAAESAMLREFARWLEGDRVLVSYNGRSYDAPLLAARYRLARLPSPLAGRDHVDLLHPVRRRYRGRWENCRLATIEQRVLGVVREDDLPGAQAPRAWLGYLRGGPATDLRRVAAHNAQDLRSLAALLLHLSGAPEGLDADNDESAAPGFARAAEARKLRDEEPDPLQSERHSLERSHRLDRSCVD
jgi:uncharacterized protein YprB with RNaseH-like and TPR domain